MLSSLNGHWRRFLHQPDQLHSGRENAVAVLPIEASPAFAMFALESGVMLGLWSKHIVEPAAMATGGGGELAFSVASNDVVNSMYIDWISRGLVIAQALTHMDFGYTFVAVDPDGHRLRVFAPSEQ